MQHESFAIEIGGTEATDLYDDIAGLEVELDAALAAMVRLKLAIRQQTAGGWTWLDDERLGVWKKLRIEAGLGTARDEVFSGYITHVKPAFEADPERSTLEIWGIDESVVMDRQEKLAAWPNKKDSDIAGEIIGQYGFTPDVQDTAVVHDEAVSTIMQRETDMQFLGRLARRNGFDCYVERQTVHFAAPRLGGPPQPVLAVHFGDETNVRTLAIEVDALQTSHIAMLQVGRVDKQVASAVVQSAGAQPLGARDAAALLPAGVDPRLTFLRGGAATGSAEMTALCQALHDESSWFVSAEGEIAANQYGHVLMPRSTVAIKGVGECHSGVYYVTHVTHRFSAEGYTQAFRARRNGIMPTGAEDFSPAS